MSDIILYDIPTKDPRESYSWNPLKTRILLNYKQIPYTTEWTEFPDIAHKFKSLGLTPNSDGTPYTCPMIRDSNGKYIMGSGAIAAELEKQYPEPPLYLDSPLLPKVQAAIMQVMGPLRAQASSTLLSDVLSERSADYWREKAEAKFGMPLATLQEQNAGEKAWEKVVPTIKEIGDLLKAEGGPFLMGKTVSYSDFVMVATMTCLKRIDETIYDRVVHVEPALKVLFEASKEWVKRIDH